MKFKLWLETDLSWILADPGADSRVGPETGERIKDGIAEYRDPYGSIRFVKYINNTPIAGIQIVNMGDKQVVANIYTDPNYRRQGLATELFNHAKQIFPDLQHSDKIEPEGNAWRSSL